MPLLPLTVAQLRDLLDRRQIDRASYQRALAQRGAG
jgi:hypothetical protein